MLGVVVLKNSQNCHQNSVSHILNEVRDLLFLIDKLQLNYYYLVSLFAIVKPLLKVT